MVFILSFSVIILLVISFINIGLDIARTNTINNTVESLQITSQIDKEIVELRKVTDETEESYYKSENPDEE